MALSSRYLTWPILHIHILLICHLLLSGYVRSNPINSTTNLVTSSITASAVTKAPVADNAPNSTKAPVVTNPADTMTPSPIVQNSSDVPGNASTIHPLSTTPTVAPGNLSTGEIIGIVVGVVCGGAVVIIIIMCLKKNGGYKKACSAPVTYRKGTNMKKPDRAPLTTKDKDPSPLPDGNDDHFFYDEPIRKLDPSALKSFGKRPTTLLQQSDLSERASLDGDNASAKDGGEDDFFYDEIFGTSAFTDETTKASIKELSSPSSPASEELPDLIFKDEFDFDDDDPFG